MPDDTEKEQVARLERLNAELSDSLQRCRRLLHDYQSRLAANSNEASVADGDGEMQEA
jgi:hypothetical protein